MYSKEVVAVKRCISKISAFFICAMMIMLLLPVSKPVEAAVEPGIVYYQGVVKNGGGGYSALTAVSQYYYNSNGQGYAGRGENYTAINDTSLCTIGGTEMNGLCDSGRLKGTYVSLYLGYNGVNAAHLQDTVSCHRQVRYVHGYAVA